MRFTRLPAVNCVCDRPTPTRPCEAASFDQNGRFGVGPFSPICLAEMLHYGGETWSLDVRDSPIHARIAHDCNHRTQVHWQVDLRYVATGPKWAGAKAWERPTLRFCLYGFKPQLRSWHDLEGQSFALETDADRQVAGTLFVETTHRQSTTAVKVGIHKLRFGERDGYWFTTELIAMVNASRSRIKASAIASGGPGALTDFRLPWSGRDAALRRPRSAQRADPTCEPADNEHTIQIVEDLPFGLVEVEAPVNAKCPERYARAKAHALIGLTEPCACDFGPKIGPQQSEPVPGADWRVRLHHGTRWTHFSL